jgi:hypothetical protein
VQMVSYDTEIIIFTWEVWVLHKNNVPPNTKTAF